MVKLAACLLTEASEAGPFGISAPLTRLVWAVQVFFYKTGQEPPILFSFFPFSTMYSLSKNWVWIPEKSGTEFGNLGKKNKKTKQPKTKNCLFINTPAWYFP